MYKRQLLWSASIEDLALCVKDNRVCDIDHIERSQVMDRKEVMEFFNKRPPNCLLCTANEAQRFSFLATILIRPSGGSFIAYDR